MSALKEIFSEPFYAGDVCGDIALSPETLAKFNPNHDARGRFSETDGGSQWTSADEQKLAHESMPLPLQGKSADDFAKELVAPKHDYVRTEITKFHPFVLRGQPHLKVEGVFKNKETGGTIGTFEQLFGMDKDGKFYADNVQLEILPNYQQSGIGSDYIAQCERFYKKLGVEYVTLVANVNVGSLAWALQGYDFATKKDGDEVREFFGKVLQLERKAGRLNEEQFVESAERVSRLTHSWEFATFGTMIDPSLGRKAMLRYGINGGWDGKKELDPSSLGYRIGLAYQKHKAKRT